MMDFLLGLEELDDGNIQLVMTSPPFALQRKKEYGNMKQEEYTKWFFCFAEAVYQKLREDGSFVIDLGGAYEKRQTILQLVPVQGIDCLCV